MNGEEKSDCRRIFLVSLILTQSTIETIKTIQNHHQKHHQLTDYYQGRTVRSSVVFNVYYRDVLYLFLFRLCENTYLFCLIFFVVFSSFLFLVKRTL